VSVDDVPTRSDLAEALRKAIRAVPRSEPWRQHDEIPTVYNWNDVAERTERVYEQVRKTPDRDLIEILHAVDGVSFWAGKTFCIIIATVYLYLRFLEWLCPRETIDRAVDYPLVAVPKRKRPKRNRH
jgi:phosphatidylinositol glycan class A protein